MVTNQYASRDANNAGRDINIIQHVDFAKVESIIAQVINNLANTDMPSPYQIKRNLPLAVEEKIKLNNLKVGSKYIISSYAPLLNYLNSVYESIKNIRSNPKERILQRLCDIYHEELGKFDDGNTSILEIVKVNSETILTNIKERVKKIVFESKNIECTEEEIDSALNIVLADAFISCQIFESGV